jgi:hypothetical protein
MDLAAGLQRDEQVASTRAARVARTTQERRYEQQPDHHQHLGVQHATA